jgi:hypothetical protein
VLTTVGLHQGDGRSGAALLVEVDGATELGQLQVRLAADITHQNAQLRIGDGNVIERAEGRGQRGHRTLIGSQILSLSGQ